METHGVDWGSRETNGCGTFNGVTDKALREIARMGFTHIWLTGVLRHATQTSHPGLAAQPKSIVKGLAGSPYAVVDYFDVDPDLASSPEKRMDEFKALVKRCRTVGLLPMMDFIPNHVSRAYLADWDGHDDFGEGDDPHTFFSPEQGYFYLTSNSPGDGPPLRLPDGLFEGEMTFGRVTGNNAVTWNPGKYDWYETVKLNYGYNFMAGLPALRLLPGWTSPKQHVPKTWRIMDDILSFWQSLGIGGFRCDMAQMIPMAFWKWAISRSRVRLPDVFFMAEAYNDHMKTTPGDPCAALLDAGFNAVYDSDCYHLALHMYTENNWANDFDRLFRSNPIYMTHGVRYVENHDETRVCSPLSWGGVGRVVLPAVMTLVYASGSGPVLVYNGQEVGERAEGPGGFGGHDGRTSSFDYTCLPRLQPELKVRRVDAHVEPQLPVLVPLRLGQEIAAVDEGTAIAPSPVLVGGLLAQDHERVVLVGGGTSGAPHRLDAVANGRSGRMTLHHVASVQGDPVVIRLLKIQGDGHQLFQPDGAFALVHHPHRPRDHVLLFKHTVVEDHAHAGSGVLQADLQGIRPLPLQRSHRRHSGNLVFPAVDGMSRRLSRKNAASVGIPHSDALHPVVAAVRGGKFLRKEIQ